MSDSTKAELAALWKSLGPKIQQVTLVEYGAKVFIRELSGGDREAYDSVANGRPADVVVWLLHRSVCNEDRIPILDEKTALELWQRAGWSGLNGLLEEIFALNGLSLKSQAEIRGNSESGKLDSSGSTLPQPSE